MEGTGEPMTVADVIRQAEAEGFTLIKSSGNSSGYKYVSYGHFSKDESRNYQAWVMRGGAQLTLGFFATAEEAALCVARSPEGHAAGSVSAPPPGPPPMAAQEAAKQAEAEGLTLLRSAYRNTGYEGVYLNPNFQSKVSTHRYNTCVWRDCQQVSLGFFATAEEVRAAAMSPPRDPGTQHPPSASCDHYLPTPRARRPPALSLTPTHQIPPTTCAGGARVCSVT